MASLCIYNLSFPFFKGYISEINLDKVEMRIQIKSVRYFYQKSSNYYSLKDVHFLYEKRHFSGIHYYSHLSLFIDNHEFFQNKNLFFEFSEYQITDLLKRLKALNVQGEDKINKNWKNSY